MYYAIINYQFNTGELQNVQKLVKQTLQALLAETGNVNFCTTFEIIFLVDGPWKSNVVLEKSLKNGSSFLYEPWNYACEKHKKLLWFVSRWNFFDIFFITLLKEHFMYGLRHWLIETFRLEDENDHEDKIWLLRFFAYSQKIDTAESFIVLFCY